jgi:hypothetical protein
MLTNVLFGAEELRRFLKFLYLRVPLDTMRTIFSNYWNGQYILPIKSVYDKPHNWLFMNLDTQRCIKF